MEGSCSSFAFKVRRFVLPLPPGVGFKKRFREDRWKSITCSGLESKFSKLAATPNTGKSGRGKIAEDAEERGGFEQGGVWDSAGKSSKSARRVRIQAMQPQTFSSARPRGVSRQDEFYPRCSPKDSAPQSRDTPPKRDTGIASEKYWGINLLNEKENESGTNEDGSTWYCESGEDLGENGYRCRWTVMGGRSHDGSSEWRETWWEKSDWTGYKELGVEKSGKNAQGDSWWETWQEVLHQDDWRFLSEP